MHDNKDLKDSFAMALVKEVEHNARRWFTAFIVVLIMWLITIGSFLMYLNQYEFTSEEYIVEITEGKGDEIL